MQAEEVEETSSSSSMMMDPWSIFLYGIKAPMTRRKYRGRLAKFFDFIDLTEGTMEERAKTFTERSKKLQGDAARETFETLSILLLLAIFFPITIISEHTFFTNLHQVWAFAPTMGNTSNGNINISYSFVTAWGSAGNDAGEFEGTSGVDIDSQGYVYVADYGNNRIQKFDSNGTFVTLWGTQGSGSGQFDSPDGLRVDSQGYVYVADYGNNRIQKFDSNGTFVTLWGTQGSGSGQFDSPNDVAIDSQGYVYIADWSNERIQVWAPSTL